VDAITRIWLCLQRLCLSPGACLRAHRYAAGMDNNSYGSSNQDYSSQVVQPSPDALSEFKVVTSNFSAEYGRVGGAVVTAALRSGITEFHGTLYEFLRNTELNAIGYQFGLIPATFQKPTMHRNQFGGPTNRPICHDPVRPEANVLTPRTIASAPLLLLSWAVKDLSGS
jgi:hypothetical protein